MVVLREPAQRAVNTANHSTVSCSVRTRPIRSDRMPAIQPPAADASSVIVPMKPASASEMPQVATSVGITNDSICVSIPSSM